MQKMGISLQPLSEMGATFYEAMAAAHGKQVGNDHLNKFEKFEGILGLKGDKNHESFTGNNFKKKITKMLHKPKE
jgi:hypothetical protein